MGIRLVDAGANALLRGSFGETALHWAAMLGEDRLVAKLIPGSDLNLKDQKYNSSPLGWVMHGWSNSPAGDQGRQREVVVLLLAAGAKVDPEWLNSEKVQGDAEISEAMKAGMHQRKHEGAARVNCLSQRAAEPDDESDGLLQTFLGTVARDWKNIISLKEATSTLRAGVHGRFAKVVRSPLATMGLYGKYILPRFIDLAMRNKETAGLRAEWLPHAGGDVLEVGIGSGLNLPFYSSRVRKVYGLDPSVELQQLAMKRVADAQTQVEFFIQSAEEPVPLPDASIDTAVITWTLCSILRLSRKVRQPVKTLVTVR